ncbi:uncharacterized protein CC84DRAFT_1251106 [Paraphaeosphaeria sporulosa]|uniref:Uncharacterized protein n=1 Tax=Paraphaeosphaeria sporulosa TaxID=1460663 RepID=A0A177C6B0_9PLEO|nr:uncharacterized protein CC84DRAFT_1251106 [Paraphaeosphaeria sporulosa]OAG03065.1 hypothetical protein CC84DRAFT_1251106 [Paraphaeosphaeria sporulosa]
MLSPRVISFARDQVYWECFSQAASEESVDRVWDRDPHLDNFNKFEMVNLFGMRRSSAGYIQWSITPCFG